jgi:cytoskeletal protein RodZ
MNIGSELAQARERCGLSLVELSRRTKIRVATLRAIERDDIDALPGGIYTRGFLRAYASEVGCDAEAIVARYRQHVEEQRENAERLHDEADESSDSVAFDAALNQPAPAPTALVAVIVLGTGVFCFSALRDRHVTPAFIDAVPSHAAAAQPPAATPASAPEPSGPRADPQPARPVQQAGTLQLDIAPRGWCWLEGTADGQPVISRLVRPDERIQIQAQRDVVLRVGDAGVFAFSINGMAARQLGAAGEAVTIHLTPDNLAEFLSRDRSSNQNLQ